MIETQTTRRQPAATIAQCASSAGAALTTRAEISASNMIGTHSVSAAMRSRSAKLRSLSVLHAAISPPKHDPKRSIYADDINHRCRQDIQVEHPVRERDIRPWYHFAGQIEHLKQPFHPSQAKQRHGCDREMYQQFLEGRPKTLPQTREKCPYGVQDQRLTLTRGRLHAIPPS